MKNSTLTFNCLKSISFLKSFLFLLITSSFLISCSSFKTALFDQHSYEEAISIKVESMNLIDKATEAYPQYSTSIEKVLLNAQKLHEYEKNKPNNETTTKMWAMLIDTDKNLLAGFFKRWKNETKLSASFTTEAKKQIEEAMQILLKFEGQKSKENRTLLENFVIKNQ